MSLNSRKDAVNESSFEKFLKKTKAESNNELFSSVCGNPPYQSSVNDINSDIWPHFIEISSFVSESGSFIHPARWVIPKKTMIPIQNKLVAKGLNSFNYLTNSPFPNQRSLTVNQVKKLS